MRHDTSVPGEYICIFEFACVVLCGLRNLFGSECCPGPLNLFWRNLASNQMDHVPFLVLHSRTSLPAIPAIYSHKDQMCFDLFT